MSSFTAIGVWVVGTLLAVSLWVVYLAIVLAWLDRRTADAAYFVLPEEARARFRSRLRVHARLLRPTLALLARTSSVTMSATSFRVLGIAGPRGSCSAESFRAGAAYRPTPEDIFVVTQMRSGTTWMQHLVHQVLSRGRVDLGSTGTALAGVSPWLEGTRNIPLDRAPLVGEERPSRVVKTHFPAHVCPFVPEARYVYVVRHPLSCFASCVDFVRAQLGPFAPDVAALGEWYGSEDMWWGSWPGHVDGWWRRAQESDAVLFVRYEDMKSDLPAVAQRLGAFLGLDPLDDAELSVVTRRCSFSNMRAHAEVFAMHPPSLIVVEPDLLPSGSARRHRDVPPEVGSTVLAWCQAQLPAGGYPLGDAYSSTRPTADDRAPD
jgi:hypothetical protein